MIVLTIDQKSSTTRGDLVPALLGRLQARGATGDAARGLVRPFERTVGDEVQGVLAADDDGARLAVQLIGDVLRDGGWSVGVGVGGVDEPLPATSRAAAGPAFVRARAAVEEAKGRGSAVPLAVVGPPDEPAATIAGDAQALLRLLGALAARRSAAGWEAIDTLGEHGGVDAPQRATAARLAISEQAVSQRLRTALWAEEVAARPLAARLLRAADAAATADDGRAGENDDEE
ncbi:hypothetical protein GCM10009718_24490 [Isoptericola halotolerans]|uniref:SatD family protein n=1 Tax=Isoptericola halotolerans TaxID=300560 RepID=A0ABX2A5Q3_9MICO|nr:hypothetical protein [Isoptericola halotolerans]NOV97986.1 hypothetical protein [Isoptericola halotolerans]